MFNEDGRTDVTNLIVAFRTFANASYKMNEDQISYILRRNCLLSGLIEGKIKGKMQGTRKRRRRRKQILDDLKERRRYWKLKEEALDRSLWRTRFGNGYGPAVRQCDDDYCYYYYYLRRK